MNKIFPDRPVSNLARYLTQDVFGSFWEKNFMGPGWYARTSLSYGFVGSNIRSYAFVYV